MPSPLPATSRDGLFIGLMSGTSADAVDAALVQVSPGQAKVMALHSLPLPDTVHDRIVDLNRPVPQDLDRLYRLDVELGELFADTVELLLDAERLDRHRIIAIGSHGQTIRHRPHLGFSTQIGRPDLIALRTGIDTVADFRNRDVALGGQGAPLLPRVHQALLAKAGERRVVLNLGGMANITLLDGETLVGGFDTGPANVLLDAWHRQHRGGRFDPGGAWAASTSPDPLLLQRLLNDDYFCLPPPKSTGREHFSLDWLQHRLVGTESAATVQATLAQLTCQSVVDAIGSFAPARLIVCGGGVFNRQLMTGLQQLLPQAEVESVAVHGLDPMAVEAAAFAWFAWAHLNRVPANAPQVTGASGSCVLGALHPGYRS